MTDASESRTGTSPTFRLIYRSRSRIPPERRKAELGAIFSVARSTNKTLGVTGALLITGNWFVQALEGDRAVVESLYDKIYRDARHEQVTLVEARPADRRVFERWAMARVSEDGSPDIPLLTNVHKGGISPAAPRPTTPEQDTMLDFMRASISSESSPR